MNWQHFCNMLKKLFCYGSDNKKLPKNSNIYPDSQCKVEKSCMLIGGIESRIGGCIGGLVAA